MPVSPYAVAHRGGPGMIANAGLENTLAAFARAVALGSDDHPVGLETDVRASADGVPVLHHDADLARTTGSPGMIAHLTWRELSRRRVGGREPLARLDDLLDAFPRSTVNVDVKDAGAVAATVAAIRRTRSPGRVTVASFSPLRAAAVRHALGSSVRWSATPPEIATLLASIRLRPLAALLGSRIAAIQVPVSMLTRASGPALLERAHGVGIEVHAWTVDEPAQMRDLLRAGVDALISDRPDLLVEVLRARRGPTP